jgi:ADP-L-glycero-D-manno-heptose 6-epimerase
MGANDFKWRNVAKRRLFDIIPPEATAEFLNANQEKVGGVFHVGALSATTETDIDAIVGNKCDSRSTSGNGPARLRFIGATYGDGREGSLDRFYADCLSRPRPPMPMG